MVVSGSMFKPVTGYELSLQTGVLNSPQQILMEWVIPLNLKPLNKVKWYTCPPGLCKGVPRNQPETFSFISELSWARNILQRLTLYPSNSEHNLLGSAFCCCNKILENNNLKEESFFYSSKFQKVQSILAWLHCFRPAVRQKQHSRQQQSKDACFMAPKKQADREKVWKAGTRFSSQDHTPMIHILQVGHTS